MRKLVKLAMSILLLNAFNASAQNVGIGTNAPNGSAQLDITSASKGLLIPRVSLTSLTDVTTIPTPATGLLVFNTNAAVTGGTGFYYNSGTTAAPSWLKLQTGAGGGGSGSGWGLTGNAGTDGSINFIGTTDDQPLVFKVNNGYAGQIGSLGLIAIGRGAVEGEQTNDPGIIAIGDSTLLNNFQDFSEIAIGNNALFSYSRGGDNNPGDNVAIGNFSMLFNNGGKQNTGVGMATLLVADDSSNTAVGWSASRLSLGFQNVAVGAESLFGDGQFGDNGAANTAVGYAAHSSNFNGVLNVSLGRFALLNGTSGDLNTAVGAHSLIRDTSGSGNIGIGFRAGDRILSGNGNVCIGDSATTSTGILNNTIAIGTGTIVDQNNRALIGNTSTTSIGGPVNWSVISDGRYKKDVAENVKGLDFIMKLRPVTYAYDYNKMNGLSDVAPTFTKRSSSGMLVTSPKLAKLQYKKGGADLGKLDGRVRAKAGFPDANPNEGVRFTGFIAQEVEAAANSVGFEFSGVDKPTNDKAKYALRYAEFVVPLVKAVQEQQTVIEAQNRKIEELTRRLERLENK
jgi:trimeric autotransporter adhesin